MKEKELLAKMLRIEKNACSILEEAKEKANKSLNLTRNDARGLMRDTNESLDKNREQIKEQLINEAKQEVMKINEQKKQALDRIDIQANQKKEEAICSIKKYLFNHVLGDL